MIRKFTDIFIFGVYCGVTMQQFFPVCDAISSMAPINYLLTKSSIRVRN